MVARLAGRQIPLPFQHVILDGPCRVASAPCPGHVVVAAHTVKGASEVKVTLHDQTTATARVVGADPASDIAVLQLALPRTRTEALRPVVLGSSAGLRIGQVGDGWLCHRTAVNC
jgi:S1-C subfamily serine protease